MERWRKRVDHNSLGAPSPFSLTFHVSPLRPELYSAWERDYLYLSSSTLRPKTKLLTTTGSLPSNREGNFPNKLGFLAHVQGEEDHQSWRQKTTGDFIFPLRLLLTFWFYRRMLFLFQSVRGWRTREKGKGCLSPIFCSREGKMFLSKEEELTVN